ncbi:MAG: tryptophan-rich sensory protein [Clostridia bacterium]|nr:tryptophan-rich sensory protein [Clostridia bacterium]
MKAFFLDLKRRIRCELICINPVLTAVFSSTAAFLGVIFALGGVDADTYDSFIQPRGALSPFFCVAIWIIMYALYGAAASEVASAKCRIGPEKRTQALALAACTLVLSYVWTPMVYRAANFFLASMLTVVTIIALAALYALYSSVGRICSAVILIYTLWHVYILYYTFALFLLM